MIPKTIILGTVRVPTMISHSGSPLIICGGPFALTMKGEFYRDQKWSCVEAPLNEKTCHVQKRIFGNHEFLYRSVGGRPGRLKPGVFQQKLQDAFDQFIAETKEALAA